MNNKSNTKNFRRVTSVGVLCIALLGSVVFSGCTQQQRNNITESTRAQFGIPRKISLYAADGKLIREWHTKTGIDDKGGSITFLDATGSRVLIGGTFVIEEDK